MADCGSHSFRLRNILEMWKVRSPCNVHKHSKHRRTPLYLLEMAVQVGRLPGNGGCVPTARLKSAFLVLRRRPQGGAEGPWIQKIKIPFTEKDKKREERLNLKLDFIKNNLNMNPKATIVSLTNVSFCPAPSIPPSLIPFLSPPSFLRLQKQKTRAVRKAC